MPEPEWKRFEKHVQDLLHLDPTPGSGNQWHAPFDAVDNTHYSESSFPLMVDCKVTTLKSYAVTRLWMASMSLKAKEMGKRFVLAVRFASPNRAPEEYVMLSLDDFVELLEKAK